MAAPRKRPREIDEASRAECPFQIRLIDQKERDLKKKKRRKDDDPDDANAKIPVQLSPFAPTGKFKTHETMDIAYAVEPSSANKRWTEMTRYNSFVRMYTLWPFCCRIPPSPALRNSSDSYATVQ